MQLGGSLSETFTVPIPELGFVMFDEPPPQLAMIPATARRDKTPSTNTPACGCLAIHRDFMTLLQ